MVDIQISRDYIKTYQIKLGGSLLDVNFAFYAGFFANVLEEALDEIERLKADNERVCYVIQVSDEWGGWNYVDDEPTKEQAQETMRLLKFNDYQTWLEWRIVRQEVIE